MLAGALNDCVGYCDGFGAICDCGCGAVATIYTPSGSDVEEKTCWFAHGMAFRLFAGAFWVARLLKAARADVPPDIDSKADAGPVEGCYPAPIRCSNCSRIA